MMLQMDHSIKINTLLIERDNIKIMEEVALKVIRILSQQRVVILPNLVSTVSRSRKLLLLNLSSTNLNLLRVILNHQTRTLFSWTHMLKKNLFHSMKKQRLFLNQLLKIVVDMIWNMILISLDPLYNLTQALLFLLIFHQHPQIQEEAAEEVSIPTQHLSWQTP